MLMATGFGIAAVDAERIARYFVYRAFGWEFATRRSDSLRSRPYC